MATSSDETVTCYGFMKIGRRANMESLLHKGQVYCQPLANFLRLEESPVIKRADPDEGLLRAYGADVTRITATFGDNKTFQFSPGTGPLKLWTPQSQAIHIYCLFMIGHPFGNGQHLMAKTEWLGMGEAYVVIWNVPEFLRRVEKSAQAVASRLRQGTVEYVSRTAYAGEMGPFRKYEDFRGQSEFRLAIDASPPTDQPIIFEVGPMKDIAIIGNTSSFQPVDRR